VLNKIKYLVGHSLVFDQHKVMFSCHGSQFAVGFALCDVFCALNTVHVALVGALGRHHQ
jgi:hypothetical protein